MQTILNKYRHNWMRNLLLDGFAVNMAGGDSKEGGIAV